MQLLYTLIIVLCLFLYMSDENYKTTIKPPVLSKYQSTQSIKQPFTFFYDCFVLKWDIGTFSVLFVCLFDLILYILSTIFHLCRDSLPGLNQYLARITFSVRNPDKWQILVHMRASARKGRDNCFLCFISKQIFIDSLISMTALQNCRASDFFQDWWAKVTRGAKNGGSFSEMMSISN